MKNKKTDKFVNDALNGIKEFSEANAIIGDTIITPNGTVIIPVSRVTAGLISGRGEYGEVKFFQSRNDYPHSNGGGGLVSIKPIGFLIEKDSIIKFIKCPVDFAEKTLDSLASVFENYFNEVKNEKQQV